MKKKAVVSFFVVEKEMNINMIKKGGTIRVIPQYKNDESLREGEDKQGKYKLFETTDMTFEDNRPMMKFIRVKAYGNLDFDIGDEIVVDEIIGVSEVKNHARVVIICKGCSNVASIPVKDQEFNPFR